MWSDHIEARAKYGADDILKDFEWTEEAGFKKAHPKGFFGVDKLGRPLFIDRIGMFNDEEMFKHTTAERMWKAVIY